MKTFFFKYISDSGRIGFSASLTYNMTVKGAPVVFDKVITNAGRGYNNNTGAFTASVDGYYMIHYHALSEFGEVCFLINNNSFVKDDE